jgi:hypothetical protein
MDGLENALLQTLRRAQVHGPKGEEDLWQFISGAFFNGFFVFNFSNSLLIPVSKKRTKNRESSSSWQ